ncbi:MULTISPECIES: hypothetical protein [Bacillus]|uniref:Uncharacterized protein n=2 Tax=Bacillus thuringiensis TaxID=1428 RepID=A0A9X6VCC8_BACTU|nr:MULTISPECIES: hypothetical protein [Bacillus]AFV21678.1 hypothetical protein BTB_502p03730 [Bacillus thuringiensis Bt407]EEM25293.1 hypothetical protein bthur0002_59350 [Bacillus thuringiensis Bt407]ERI01146.1 hypothetical protein BTCBT_002701 [Bacillus thuringiensis T01-328]MBN6707900.1 hypothetical protein [Bacillus thuringiensis]MCU5282112.1 hypothetical protein [Bacillus cereus]
MFKDVIKKVGSMQNVISASCIGGGAILFNWLFPKITLFIIIGLLIFKYNEPVKKRLFKDK